jgi:crotonobetainyl-CoA:carnitine CoA-transferase CaiB-like acyl-CoA transferase
MDPATLLANPHLRERAFFYELKQPDAGTIPLAANIFRMSETPLLFGSAPRLGEHTGKTLAAAGYETDEVTILRERGVA